MTPAHNLLSYRTEDQLNYNKDLDNTEISKHFDKDRYLTNQNTKKRVLLVKLSENLKNVLSSRKTQKFVIKENKNGSEKIMRSFREQRAAIDKIERCKLTSG